MPQRRFHPTMPRVNPELGRALQSMARFRRRTQTGQNLLTPSPARSNRLQMQSRLATNRAGYPISGRPTRTTRRMPRTTVRV